jgi:glutamate-1-semialdehyde 2,1-aminomutase
MANGFPLAAVGGRASAMAGVSRTWMSSTLATEWVALAASLTTLRVVVEHQVPAYLTRLGGRLLGGLQSLASRHQALVAGVAGIPEMTLLELRDPSNSGRLARAAARRGLLFKRSPYNFVSLAHDDAAVDWSLGVLDESLTSLARGE